MALPVGLDLGNGRHESAPARFRAAPSEKWRESRPLGTSPTSSCSPARVGE